MKNNDEKSQTENSISTLAEDLSKITTENLNNNHLELLEKELAKIDQVFENDIENLNLMEENNLDVLRSLNLDSSQNIEKGNNNNKNKHEKIIDTQMIINSIPWKDFNTKPTNEQINYIIN